jgi:hypothetical protein
MAITSECIKLQHNLINFMRKWLSEHKESNHLSHFIVSIKPKYKNDINLLNQIEVYGNIGTSVYMVDGYISNCSNLELLNEVISFFDINHGRLNKLEHEIIKIKEQMNNLQKDSCHIFDNTTNICETLQVVNEKLD